MDNAQRLLDLLKKQKDDKKQKEIGDGLENLIEKIGGDASKLKGNKGDNGYTPVKGVDYFDGKDADEQKIVRTVIARIPKPKDGYTPVKGVDYFDGEDAPKIDEEKLIRKISEKIPVPKDGSPDTADDIRNKLELLPQGQKLKLDAIEGQSTFNDSMLFKINKTIESLDNHRVFGIKLNGERKPQANGINFIGSGIVITHDGEQGVNVDLSGISGGSGVSSFNTRTGVVTLTSLDVTNALGYTPEASLWLRDNTNGYLFPNTLTDSVGIGTVTPLFRLQVVAASGTGISIATTASSVGAGLGLEFQYGTGAVLNSDRIARIMPNLQSGGGGDLFFQTAASATAAYVTQMTILRGGNVGIGTTNPTSLLYLKGSATNNAVVSLQPNANGDDMGLKLISQSGAFFGGVTANSATGEIRYGGQAASFFPTFYSGNSEAMRISTTGNVGIGVTTPTQLLTLASTGGFGFDSGSGTADTILTRDAANTLALGNGTNAQTFEIGLSGSNGITGANVLKFNTNVRTANIMLDNSTGAFTITPPTSAIGITFGGAGALGTLTTTGFVGTAGVYANGFIATNPAVANANFFAASTNGTSISGPLTTARYVWGGATTLNLRTVFGGSSTTAISVGGNYSNVLFAASPFSGAASGTNAWAANVVVTALGTYGAGAGNVLTNTASLYVDGASAAGTNNYALYIASGAIGIGGSSGSSGQVLTSQGAGASAVWSTVSGGSGITRSVNAISTATGAGSTAATDYVYFVSGTTTLTLPTAVGNTNQYTVKRTDATLVTTIATTSAQTIDGASTFTLSTQYESVSLISNGSNWLIV